MKVQWMAAYDIYSDNWICIIFSYIHTLKCYTSHHLGTHTRLRSLFHAGRPNTVATLDYSENLKRNNLNKFLTLSVERIVAVFQHSGPFRHRWFGWNRNWSSSCHEIVDLKKRKSQPRADNKVYVRVCLPCLPDCRFGAEIYWNKWRLPNRQKNVFHLYEKQVSLPFSQNFPTRPYPEIGESTPHIHTS